MLLLSIIIPVYNNSEKDIERCINSLQNSYEIDNSFEIIMVDDGSSDDCARFLDKIAVDFSNIRVFHQKNHGVSSARNLGICVSLGKYIAFVDADDVVTTNFIEDAIWVIKHNEIDIIYGYVKFVNKDNSKNISKNIYANNEKEINYTLLSEQKIGELYCHFFDLSKPAFWQGNYYISRGSVARLVRKELAIHNLFNENLNIGEDAVWNLQMLQRANKVGIIKRLWYYYIKNDLSATQVFNEKCISQYTKMIKELSKYAINDAAKACLLNKTISAACELAKGFFLSEHYHGNISTAIKDFNQLFNQEPWNSVLCFPYACMSGWKCCVKYLLVKSGLLLIFLKLRILIEK